MPLNNQKIEELAELLLGNARLLRENPCCTYLVRLTLRRLDEVDKDSHDQVIEAISRFNRFLENDIWNSGSSTVSGALGSEIQAEFVNRISKYMSAMARLLIDGKSREYLSIEEDWKNDFRVFLDHVRISSIKPRSVAGASLNLTGKLERWEKEFGELINEHGLIMKHNKPLFLLKSGYRSTYFFNPSHLVSKSNAHGQENQRILDGFRKVLGIFIDHLKSEFLVNEIAVLLTQKFGGEDPGTSQLAALFTEYGVPVVHLDPYLDFPKGPIIDGKMPLLIPFNGVITTGKTSGMVVERYERIFGSRPRVYCTLWNRSSETKTGQVPILQLAPPVRIIPDIMFISIASFDKYLGRWWSGLPVVHQDYLRDVYFFENETDDNYQTARNESENLVRSEYEISGSESALLFGFYDTKLPFTEVATFLINMDILCWNALSDDLNSEEPHLVKHIEAMLREEKSGKLITRHCSSLLRRRLKENSTRFPALLDPVQKIVGIFLEESEDIHSFLTASQALTKCPPSSPILTMKAELMKVYRGELLSNAEREALYERRQSIEKALEKHESADPDLDRRLLIVIDRTLVKSAKDETKAKLGERVGLKKATELEQITIPT